MSDTFIPWYKYALIADIAERWSKAGNHLGKTALQKAIYLLQTLKGVDAGYDFSLYHVRAFDSSVLYDLDFAELMGAVKVTSNGMGYAIKPSAFCDEIRKGGEDFVQSNSEAIEEIATVFGGFSAKQLELLSTIVFVDRSEPELDRKDLIKRVHAIKPHFGESDVESYLQQLEDNDYVSERE